MTEEFASGRVDYRSHERLSFPVVGVGASGTGVTSLDTLLSGLSPDTKMTLVIVQQLPRNRAGMTVELLQRATGLAVEGVEDNRPIEQGRVYLGLPGHRVTVANGRLHLEEPSDASGHRWPIDDLFRSLATEQGERAIVVLLAGDGTNGMFGARAVKATGGLCIEQEPDSKEHRGEPRGITHDGSVDEVLKIGQIPKALSRLVEHVFGRRHVAAHAAGLELSRAERSQLTELLAILRARTGQDCSGYRPSTLLFRTQRRMRLAGADTLGDYASVLRERPDEALALASDLVINSSGFFRKPEAWEALRLSVIRPLLADHQSSVLRAWVAGCATGEEAYSLAILLNEEIEAAGRPEIEIKIFATEASEPPLAFARAGLYPAGIEADVSPERLARFFEKGEYTYRVSRRLRQQLIFAPHNLFFDPPFSRLHLSACRSLLVHLEPDSQRAVLSLFQFGLRAGGHLFLGDADAPGGLEDGFDVVDRAARIFRRNDSSVRRVAELKAHPLLPPAELRRSMEIAPPAGRAPTSLSVQEALLEHFGPPTLVVDRHDRIVYFFGGCTPYLEQPSGEPTRNLFDLLRPSLRAVVRSVLRRAMSTSRVAVHASDAVGFGTLVTVTAAPLMAAPDPQYFRVSFESGDSAGEASRIPRPQMQLASQREREDAIEEELRSVRRELRSTVEAYEAGYEELKQALEEVNSVNEELQSMKDELESSNQQLQTVNDELLTLNAELRVKITEVETASNDMSSLLDSASLAVILLDRQLNIQRFTAAVTEILNVIPSDVGRPLEHLAQIDGADLLAAARAVLENQAPVEGQVRSHNGQWYLRRTAVHRTSDDRIDGVVVSFTAIKEWTRMS